MVISYKAATVKMLANKAVESLTGVQGRGAQLTRCKNILNMAKGHSNQTDVQLSLEDYNALTLLPDMPTGTLD